MDPTILETILDKTTSKFKTHMGFYKAEAQMIFEGEESIITSQP
jgi:hypothetical protein